MEASTAQKKGYLLHFTAAGMDGAAWSAFASSGASESGRYAMVAG
jgi:hypothetical protein